MWRRGEGGRGRAEVMMTSQGSESTSFFHVIIGEAPLLKKKERNEIKAVFFFCNYKNLTKPSLLQ